MKNTGRPQKVAEHRRQVREYYNRREPDDIFDQDQYTCSEHYSPYYGYLVADRLAELARTHRAYHILEVGGGRGRLALDILNRFKDRHEDLYQKIRYIIVDISYQLNQYQKKVLSAHDKGRYVNGSATHLPFGDRSLKNAIILSNEVLADLPSLYTGQEEVIPGPVEELIRRAGLVIGDRQYLNSGALEFLLEVRRILWNGVLLIIEYGVEKDPRARVLGPDELSHIEIAIERGNLKKAADFLFKNTRTGPLVDLFGEEALKDIFLRGGVAVPPQMRKWLFELVWLTEHMEGKGLEPGRVEDFFVRNDNRQRSYFARFKNRLKQIEDMAFTNTHQEAFIKNLMGLFVAFERRFGRDDCDRLIKALRQVHQLQAETMLEETARAGREHSPAGDLEEDFFFLSGEI